ncbi:myotubularin-related protein 12 isoform X2 [Balaenoptera musculus]|uniref:Myotubularin-related protein 12 n=2 Tax=Balaenoptera musculus TaxID=9771 RepID=A0A8B8X5N7_BALMU|nr:myotubularin-related protein 12 isoform X2 [Balaenoptera musculus]
MGGAPAASAGGRCERPPLLPRVAASQGGGMLGKGVVGGGGGTKAPKPSFVSYVRPEEIHTNEKEVTEKEVTLHLLPGEQLLCEASTVLKCVQEDSCQRGIYGRLVCTDFKIAFLGDDESALDNDETQFKNKVIGENDITLHCVDQIYGVFDEKKKTLFGQLKKYPEKLIIHCKDLRVFHFCLRYTKEEEVKRIVSGIIHHTQAPKLLKRLFLFSYATAAQNHTATDPKNHAVMFDTLQDWCWELERTKGNMKYKAVSVNEGYKVCERLPAYFVVPTPLPEEDVPRFQGHGIPIWCWSCHSGCALLKMSALPKEQDDGILQIQKNFLDGIYKTIHRPPYETVKTEDLSSNFLSLQEIQTAYSKFKQLFLIDNSTEFWDTDIKWFSLLESSSWLDIIRRCLKKAIEIIECLEAQNMNVLLLEENASDLCCLVSSLVQVMMDPHCRTRFGFQSLVQKEWIVGGHCFLDRCNHLRQSDKEEVPVFLLFLDCVWQLVHQHPPAFEFTETYLTVLSDSLYIPIFSTFFFNSPHQKDTNMHQRQLSLPLTQSKSSPKRGFFREETDHLIKNLLGKRISKLINSSEELQDNFREFYDSWRSKPPNYHGLLLPHIEGPEIKVWAQRYLRWIPEAQILGGGRVATLSKLLEMMEEVQRLQEKIEERHHSQEALQAEAASLLRTSARLSSLFPFALLQRHSSKPVLPTSGWKALGDEEDLAKREDEFVDLGDV